MQLSAAEPTGLRQCRPPLETAGLVNLTCILQEHVMPSPHISTHLVMQVWHKALPSVFVVLVSGDGRFGELQLLGWPHMTGFIHY